jgi:hypothetical protein
MAPWAWQTGGVVRCITTLAWEQRECRKANCCAASFWCWSWALLALEKVSISYAGTRPILAVTSMSRRAGAVMPRFATSWVLSQWLHSPLL